MATRAIETPTLAEIMRERRLGDTELARLMDVSSETVKNWRLGKRPRPKLYGRLLSVLQLSPQDIDIEPYVISEEEREHLRLAQLEIWQERKKNEADSKTTHV